MKHFVILEVEIADETASHDEALTYAQELADVLLDEAGVQGVSLVDVQSQ